MYFPTATARRLATVPALPNIPPEPVLAISPSPRKSLFCSITRNGISIWRVRPPAVLAFLSRTPASIIEHGENKQPHWSPDSRRIVIQTTESHLVLVNVTYSYDEHVYQFQQPTPSRKIFLPGPGEGFPLNGVHLQLEGVIRIEGNLVSLSPREDYILFSTRTPPAVQRIPWPSDDDEGLEDETETARRRHRFNQYDNWVINERGFDWLIDSEAVVSSLSISRSTGIETWITSDGRAYIVRLAEDGEDMLLSDIKGTAEELTGAPEATDRDLTNGWRGTCIHNFESPRWVQKQRRIDPDAPLHERNRPVYLEPKRAVKIAINAKFSLIAIGMHGGGIAFTKFPSQEGVMPSSQRVPISPNKETGPVCSMEWSSDGHVLAVGWQYGWGIFTSGGRCLVAAFGAEEHVDLKKFQDIFMHGVRSLFWSPGNFELIALAQPNSLPTTVEGQIFIIPFAKSAITGQHSPDNTRYAFLQMDDRALVYRGADQPDMSVINPESDVWQHIKIPQSYLSTNWPIRYSSISSDGRLVAIAGRRGLVHYSTSSGRWKMFADGVQEQAFSVRGGLLWFHHVLIAAVEVNKSYQIRLYSRDLELSNQNVVHREVLSAPVVVLSLVDNSLLVYTTDNSLHHYLIVPTAETIKLHLCGTISFEGVIVAPSAVRMLSWMVPTAQKQLGDPVDDLTVATVLMVVGGQLALLRPRKSGDKEVRYDMQIFAEHVEFCWIHLRGIRALENSLWGFDGKKMRIWLNALTMDSSTNGDPENVEESVAIPLEFYPLSVLMDKGIIIGADHEIATRANLSFAMFRHGTSSQLFLHYLLRYHLEAGQLREAVAFATNYQGLVYFPHALEVLLHTVVDVESNTEGETESATSLLSIVVEFLDHFDVALDVVVGCARKTEMTRWPHLFTIVGNPKSLFETCLSSGRLKTAGSYLLVLHNMEQLDGKNADAIRLLNSAINAEDWQLCREILRFLRSIDESGVALRHALSETNLDGRQIVVDEERAASTGELP
ncbi:RIC1-domain-containing protein [Marasmius fiardii PR-910]|nr:RIC1-domain-containing protein [Marasmius fiardii PR-910]